jgi:hypothetical protein
MKHKAGPQPRGDFSCGWVERSPKLKKYLVVKMAEGWSQVVNWIVMPGLYTLEAAQQFVDKAMMDEPEAQFLIQEVGAA